MKVTVFSKKGCKLCERCKEKLAVMKIKYTERDLEDSIRPHKGWRKSDAVAVRAAFAMVNDRVPLVMIDGDAYNYSGAMKRLKSGAPKKSKKKKK